MKAEESANPYPTTPCPEAAPILVNDKCHGCPSGDYYVLKNHTCYTPNNVTNVEFLNKSRLAVETDNYTLANIKTEILSNPLPTKSCPETEPLWNGKNCISCPEGSLYLLKNSSCYETKSVTNVDALQASGKYVETENYTLAILNASIHKSGLPMAPCPEKAPIFNVTKCVTCPHGDYFVLKNSTCYTPAKVHNVTALA